MESIKQKIKKLAAGFYDEILQVRRHIHMHPELSNEEYKTSDYIASKLVEYNINYTKGVFNTGILAVIEGKSTEGPVIALRADIDALPVNEKNEVDYKSVYDGKMHACGHDAHTASVLGAARILNQLREYFHGTVKLIFQPAEEKIPGGACFMIEEGVLENPSVDKIFGQHVFPELEAGKVGFKTGMYMASTDEINIEITGKGGHAAMPDILTDPVLIASQIVVSLQQIVSRNANYNIPTVLSFGRFIADGTYNVIPDKVKLKGTFRTFSEEWREKAHRRINEIATSVAQGYGGSCEVFINKGYPYLENNEELTLKAKKNAEHYLGKQNVVELKLRMTAEDFAYFSAAVPGCFYRLGTANTAKGINANLHTPYFNIEEEVLETSMGLMAWLAYNELTTD